MLPEALPYHLRVRDHFRQQTSVWEFFSAAPTREEQLSADEREARIQLSPLGNGELEIAGRIVSAIMDSEDSEPGYLETARLFNLYTRIHGDRCAGEVTGDPDHPEYALRARALQLWQETGEAADQAISRIVEGPRELGRLDIFSQALLRELTREFIFELLRPAWIRTPSMTALAYAYFADLNWDEAADEPSAVGGDELPDRVFSDDVRERLAEAPRSDGGSENAGRNFSAGARERLTEGLTDAHGSVRDYFAFVMLDFVLADASLEQRSTARASAFAADLNLSESFRHLYNRKSN
jgi:hypothetical protein